MSFAFADRRPPRRISLTPMIDVVFLLLVFFMLVARFGQEGAVDIAGAGAAAGYEGPPRLVEVVPGGLRLNGRALDAATLVAELARLTASQSDAILIRGTDGTTLQALVSAMELLRDGGFTRLVLVE